MNERGEITLSACLFVFVLMSLVLLCGLELRKSFKELEKRTKLFLCIKEIKGEQHELMKFMGRTNWGIKNIDKAKLVMLFIPGLQGASMEAEKLKKVLQFSQEGKILHYFKLMSAVKRKGCPLDPRIIQTPFVLGSRLLLRDKNGAAKLRKNEWEYIFFARPYLVTLKTKSQKWEALNPKLLYEAKEKMGTFQSLLSSPY